MELYKSRDFGAYFQDTFGFIKRHGKHLFKNFFLVTGVFILVLMVLGYFFMNFYTEMVFGSIGQSNPNYIDNYLDENLGMFLVLFGSFLVLSLVFGLVMYAFPAIYLKLYAHHNGTSFGAQDIVDVYKKNIMKLLIFLGAGIVIGIPLVIVVGLISFLLFITIIGMLALPVLIGAFSLFYVMTLMEYLEGERGIWECFGYSWKLMSSKFWAAVGCVGLFFMMSYLIQNIITIIAYVFGMVQFFTSIESGSPNPEEFTGAMSVVMIITFIGGFLIGAVLNNIVLLNQGIVFYSLKEENENINTKSIIDQIGSGD